MLLALHYPSFIKPEIIPGLPIRWYGLMYIVAFSVAFLVYRKQVRERHFPLSGELMQSMFAWGILGLVLGARIFSTIVYEPAATNIYLRKPWLIFWPFQNGQFTGFQGMSYHGGVLGAFFATLLWCRAKRFQVREICDMYCVAIPLGYTFGRFGNFFNAELVGRVTASPTGMIFPENGSFALFNAQLAWVRELALKAGIELSATQSLVNLPRHPSQLYEALFEGVILWAIMWFFRNRKPFNGFLIGLYLFGYGFFRFFIEYFREPDAGLGFRIQLGSVISGGDIARFHPPLSFSTGQLLCFAMMAAAVIWWLIASRLDGKEPVRVYTENTGALIVPKTAEEKKAGKNTRRKLRKKLR